MDGFTVFRCAAARCGEGDDGSTAAATSEALRATVQASRGGVLVTTGCLFGGAFCGGRAAAPVVVVQPCDADRRPTLCGVLVGPLRTDADVDALEAWLRAGDLDPGLLPPHLLGQWGMRGNGCSASRV